MAALHSWSAQVHPPDFIESAFLAGAVTALRRRAERQRKIAEAWTVYGERGVRVMSGEAEIALRIAASLDQAADELEAESAR
jgi:hypothetical protein